MPGTKGKSGGRREGSGRPPVPQRKPPPVYRRPPMTGPRGQEQIDAMAWWESLTPLDRTMHIKEMHYMCGWPKPHTKHSKAP